MSEVSNVPSLRCLSAKYEPTEHADYVGLLTAKLRKPGSEGPRNGALTGHYGSGKSSILGEVQRASWDAALSDMASRSILERGRALGVITEYVEYPCDNN